MRKIGITIAVGALVGLFAAVPAYAGTISATPQSGYPTDTIEVAGTGFSVLGVCSLHLITTGVPGTANLVGGCTIEPSGALTGSFEVPHANYGTGGFTLRACNGPTQYTCTETGDTSFTLLSGQAATTTAPSSTAPTTTKTVAPTSTILQTTTTQAAPTGTAESSPPTSGATPTEVVASPPSSVPCPDPPAGGSETSSPGGDIPPSALFGMGGLLALNVVTLGATNTAVGKSMRRFGASAMRAMKNIGR